MEHEAALLSEVQKNITEAANDQSEKLCYLLDKLPGELRNTIYSMVFYHPEGVVFDCISCKLQTHVSLGLSGTCKQIRQECADLLSAKNDLRLQIYTSPKTPFNATEGLELISKFCRLLKDTQLCSQFRKAHVETGVAGESEVAAFRSQDPSMFLAKSVIEACHEGNIQVRWSFIAQVGGIDVHFDIPMTNKEQALASFDGSIEPTGILWDVSKAKWGRYCPWIECFRVRLVAIFRARKLSP